MAARAEALIAHPHSGVDLRAPLRAVRTTLNNLGHRISERSHQVGPRRDTIVYANPVTAVKHAAEAVHEHTAKPKPAEITVTTASGKVISFVSERSLKEFLDSMTGLANMARDHNTPVPIDTQVINISGSDQKQIAPTQRQESQNPFVSGWFAEHPVPTDHKEKAA